MSEFRGASCQDLQAEDLMAVEEAQRQLAGLTQAIDGTELVSLVDALGRINAGDIVAEQDSPPHANAAMDGYAVASNDWRFDAGVGQLKIVGVARAGRPHPRPLKPGEAVQVMTGATIPKGADSVIINEHCSVDADTLYFGDDTLFGANVRARGEDIARGEVVIPVGTRIGPAHLGLLASLGINRLSVRRLLRVAIMSTGDELVALERESVLAVGQIYDSNRYSLLGLLKALPVEVRDFGLIADNMDATTQALKEAADFADIVLSTGGASASDADFVSKALANLGDMAFWRVALRPGRPLGVGRVKEALCFALPGNPVAVMVTFYTFVQPTILALLGSVEPIPSRFLVVAANDLRKRSGRTEIQRGRLFEKQGTVLVALAGKQGAGRLSSVAAADCLIEIEAERGQVLAGEQVWVRPLRGLNGLL